MSATITRDRWDTVLLDSYEGPRTVRSRCEFGPLVGSLLRDGTHAPVIDLDFGCELLPSRTPGHFHLYLNRRLTWRQYRRLLRALLRAGLIDRGWYRTACYYRQSFVRAPSKPHNPRGVA